MIESYSTYNKLQFREAYKNSLGAGNPFNGLGECEFLMEENGLSCDAWIRRGNGVGVNYTYANNDLLDNWVTEVTCTGIPNGLFPTVFKIGSNFYMFHRKDSDMNMYLYQSSNKINWSVMNGGNPVITRSAIPTDYNRNLYNVAVCVIGTTLHIICETNADSGTYYFPSYGFYARADISNPVFTAPPNPTFPNMVCPQMIYSPHHHGIAVIQSEFDKVYSTPPSQYMGFTSCKYAMCQDDLTLPQSWRPSTISFPEFNENIQVNNQWQADFSIVFTPKKINKMMMFTCHNQATGKQWYADLNNEKELFDTIMNHSVVYPYVTRNDFSFVALGNSLVAGFGTTGGNTFPKQLVDKIVLSSKIAIHLNNGVNSQSIAQMQANISAQAYAVNEGVYQIAVVWEIINQYIQNPTETALSIYTKYKQYCLDLIKNGKFKGVIALTALPVDSILYPQYADFEAKRQEIKGYMQAEFPNLGIYIADVGGHPQLQNPAVAPYTDGLHLNNTGAGYVADVVLSEILKVK